MSLHPGLRWALLTLISMVYALIGGFATVGAFEQWGRVITVAQRVETCIQLAFGVWSLGGAISPFLRLTCGHRIRVVWGLGFAVVAGLSGIVWGPPMPLVVLGFILAAAAMAWGLDQAVRHLTSRKALNYPSHGGS